MLTIKHHKQPEGYDLLQPEGELDAFSVPPFRRVLGNIAGSERLIIDLTQVHFIDSAGLGALIGGIRRTRELGGQIAVACSRPGLIGVLHRTGLDSLVTVATSLDKAIEAIGITQRKTAAPQKGLGTPDPAGIDPDSDVEIGVCTVTAS